MSYYRCFSCGFIFESPLQTNKSTSKYISIENTIAKVIKICGITIIILGTLLSLIIAGIIQQEHKFVLLDFLLPESISIISGLVFIGFSEVIQLLEDIKNRIGK